MQEEISDRLLLYSSIIKEHNILIYKPNYHPSRHDNGNDTERP